MKNIVKRQTEFFGHVIRKEELENFVVTGFIEGKRARGRQSETYRLSPCIIFFPTDLSSKIYRNIKCKTFSGHFF